MICSVLVVGVPSPATCPPEKTWRAAADIVAHRLHARFGPAVDVEYADLFSPGMLRHPEVEPMIARDTTLPIVLINGELAFSGGKLNVSAIERAVAAALPDASSVSAELVPHA